MERKEVRDMLPKDPIMLLSFVNMKLRDFYGRLESVGYHYDAERNQFI